MSLTFQQKNELQALQQKDELRILFSDKEITRFMTLNSAVLQGRLGYISRLQKYNDLNAHSIDPLLNYKLAEKIDPFIRSLDDLKHRLIGSYIRQNMGLRRIFEWFIKRDEKSPEYNTLARFTDDFGMRYEPLTNHNNGNEIIFNNHPSIKFYEILTQPREAIPSDIEGVRYAGRAQFEFDLNKNFEGNLMFYSDPIKLPEEIKNIAQIPLGEFYIRAWLGDKYRKAICVENENYVVEKNGSKIKSSDRFEKDKMGNYDSYWRKANWENPVVSTFRLMKFYFADEGKDKIQETRNVSWSSVHIEKDKYHTVPKKELSLDLFIEKTGQLGIAIVSEPTSHRGFDGAYDMKYKLI